MDRKLRKNFEVNSYIQGYWSALNGNTAGNHSIGTKTDMNGIIGEIKLYCENYPSTLIVQAINEVYKRMGGVLVMESLHK